MPSGKQTAMTESRHVGLELQRPQIDAIKKPNDLLIKGKKICGILQEIINKQNQKFLILGIGINLIKNPIISNYPTTNLNDLINKKISKRNIEIQLKKIFEKNLEIYKHKKNK